MNAIVFLAVWVGALVGFYLVWFRAEDLSEMLKSPYPESWRAYRAVAGSRFTVWLARLLMTLAVIALFVGTIETLLE